MDTEVPVKTEPMWLVDGGKEPPRIKTESASLPITFQCMKSEIIMRDINHVDAKNEALLSADVCDEGNRVLISDIYNQETCLLEGSSEFNYSAEDMDSGVTVKSESMWLSEDEEGNRERCTDVERVSAAGCDEINRELKTELDIEENCILGDSPESILFSKEAGDTKVLKNEGIIISSTDKLQAVEGYMLEYEEHLNVNIDKIQEKKIITKKYSRKVHKSFSKCALTSELEFKCDICEKCFKTYSDIVRHINSHMLIKPFNCEVCNKCFSRSGSLKVHMMLHTGERPFNCKECSKCFTDSGHLKYHMRTHTGEKPFKCKECSKCFTASGYLKYHMRTHTGEKPFKCMECSKCFISPGDLKCHARVHTGEKPFKCKECSKYFSRSGNLKQHVTLHTGEKPFKCTQCSKCYTESSHLKYHMRTHRGGKPFKCVECSKCFISSADLRCHMRTHTGEKPFKCMQCNKCFTQSSSLKCHMRLHTGEKPFKCKQCSKCFTESSRLVRHVRTHT